MSTSMLSKGSVKSRANLLVPFLGGAASGFPLLLIPVFSIGQLFLLPSFLQRQKPSFASFRTPIILIFLAVIGYVLPSLIGRGELARFGIATIVSLGIYVILYALWTQLNASAVVGAIAGLSTGWIIYSLTIGNTLTQSGFTGLWKYGVAVPVTLSILAVLFRLRASPMIVALALCGTAAISSFSGFRSHAIICVLVAMITVIGRNREGQKRNYFGILLIASASIILAFVAPALIEFGLFGEETRVKSIQQTSDGASLLFAGRSELPLSLAMISEYPLLGRGDLGQIQMKTFFQGIDFAASFGLTNAQMLEHVWLRNGIVNLHSALFTAWAEAGILGALIFIWIIYQSFRMSVSAIGSFAPLTVYVGVQLIWDSIFSPLNFQVLPFYGIGIILILLWRKFDGSLNSSVRNST